MALREGLHRTAEAPDQNGEIGMGERISAVDPPKPRHARLPPEHPVGPRHGVLEQVHRIIANAGGRPPALRHGAQGDDVPAEPFKGVAMAVSQWVIG